MVEEDISDHVDIKQESDCRDQIEVEIEGAEVALGLDVHDDFDHENPEESEVDNAYGEVLLLGKEDGLDIVEHKTDEGEQGDKDLKVDAESSYHYFCTSLATKLISSFSATTGPFILQVIILLDSL